MDQLVRNRQEVVYQCRCSVTDEYSCLIKTIKETMKSGS